jgi:cytidylate kinase
MLAAAGAAGSHTTTAARGVADALIADVLIAGALNRARAH